MKHWSKEDLDYFSENWGTISISTLCQTLNRTENAIKIKAYKLGLGAFLQSGDYITFNQLLHAIGITCGGGYKTISWEKNRRFPIHKKKVGKNTFKIVYINEFWKWAEKNQCFLDFTAFEENALGMEPEWVKQKRKNDWKRKNKIITTPWTKLDDERLKNLLKQFKYSYDDLSKILMRTSGAIQRRICDLKIIERPLKADNHIKWTSEEYYLLGEMIKSCYSYELMAEKLNKSSKAIRGRVYDMYLTEVLDKIRAYIGTGRFGDGRPERKIKQKLQMSVEEKAFNPEGQISEVRIDVAAMNMNAAKSK